MGVVAKLMARMVTADTLACCGLDPDVRKIPTDGDFQDLSDPERVRKFLRSVIDIAGPHVCAFKAQKAFFDNIETGHELLIDIVAAAHSKFPDVPVFVDCKVGDIDNTMHAYAELLFEKIEADGVLVNPYMGDDIFDSFLNYPDKAIIVLARTSNPGAQVLQDALLQDGRPVWEFVLDLIANRWNSNNNLIPVISSTANLDSRRVRQLVPQEMPILLAGVGAQGGDANNVRNLVNGRGVGVFVNSSRGLLYPSNAEHIPWQGAIGNAVVDFKQSLNDSRTGTDRGRPKE